MALLTAVLAGSAGIGGCAHRADSAQSAEEYVTQLQQRVSVDAVMAHLQKFQEIADANGGTRTYQNS